MCWCSISQQYPWLRCLAIFLDNATSTNKNHYLFAWAMEMVRNGELEHVHISFMIADHTKFTPDRLFSNWQCIQSSWCIHNPWATSTVCSNSWHLCRRWKACSDRHVLLGIKYSDLPGVHKLHDFIVRQHNGEIVMKVWQHCFTGAWKESPLHVIQPDIQGVPATTYKEKTRHPSAEKMANMITMYDRFIAPDQSTYHLWVVQLYLILTQQLQDIPPPSQVNLRRESKASAQFLAVTVLDIVIKHDGVKATPPKPDVLKSTPAVDSSYTLSWLTWILDLTTVNAAHSCIIRNCHSTHGIKFSTVLTFLC